MEPTITKVSDVVVEEIESLMFKKKCVDSIIGNTILLEEAIIATVSPLRVRAKSSANVECSRRTTTTIAVAGGTDFKSAKPTRYISDNLLFFVKGAYNRVRSLLMRNQFLK